MTGRTMAGLAMLAVSLAAIAGMTAGAQAPAVVASGQVASQAIGDEWEFRALPTAAQKGLRAATENWHAAHVPSEVQLDLLTAGLMPDPFLGDNEKRAQWVGETNWEYRVHFRPDARLLARQHVELVFDGLDTFAEVTLNGRPLLHTDNMFRSWRVVLAGPGAVAALLPGENELRIVLRSPFQAMMPVVAALPYVLPGTGYEPYDPSKGIYPVGHYIRTAGYPYGWDWGPRLVTMGVWKPVHLEGWDQARITNLHVEQRSVTAERALVEVQVEVEAARAGKARLDWEAAEPQAESDSDTAAGHKPGAHPTGRLAGKMLLDLDAGVNRFAIPLRIEHPKRWFPSGYGGQDRYEFSARLSDAEGKTEWDSRAEKVGLRSVELRRRPDQWGTSFAFVVNGIPVFAKGANVIPMDSFPARVTAADERKLLTQARDANMNMIRLWGGGYYQSDHFYDLCDELGLMVWQDFAFGGGMVPGDKAFQDNVRAEAVEQIRRLRDHAALVLWNGNNEVETAWDSWGDRKEFQAKITPEQRQKIWQDYVVMFRDVLKSAVAEYGGGAPYWPSSPGADFEDIAGNDHNGDMHYWSVWSGPASPIETYRTQSPRFMSEYGFQAMPAIETVRAFAGDERKLDTPALANHERFAKGFDRLNYYLKQEARPAKDFEGYIYLTQYVQAEAIKIAAEHLRSQMPRSMGSLYWQLNDCWPVVSWSSIDSFGRPKALQYYARRFYAPVLVAPVFENGQIRTSIVSDLQQPLRGVARLRVMDFLGKVLFEHSTDVTVPALTSMPLEPIPVSAIAGFDPKQDFAVLELTGEQGAGRQPALASNTLYFAKALQLELPKARIAITIEKSGKGYLAHLGSNLLARDVLLSMPGMDATFSDNNFDLIPGEKRTVRIEFVGNDSKDPGIEAARKALIARSMVDMTQ